MALQRPLTKALACQNCHRWILRSFIAGMGAQPVPNASYQRRSLSTSDTALARYRPQRWTARIVGEHPLNEINDEVERMSRAAPEPFEERAQYDLPEQDLPEQASLEQDLPEQTLREQEPPTEEHVPWYLQVQPPVAEQAENPMSTRQRIPPVPEYPPPLLQPLLEHVSIELGMDDLTLLDLRSLDPPPALGGNLFMIIGTARSERHLHVSADKLCRWLRTTYKLRPYADGLLGRNELKLKMRRKAKRSRLLSAVGAKATADSELDDGIRTGWVCVNIGRVDGGELPKTEEEIRREEAVVGFGTQTAGSNVVLQLMTEEKRGELDLENLWTEMLERGRKRRDNLTREEGGDEDVTDVVEEPIDAAAGGDVSSKRTLDSSNVSSLHPDAYVSGQDAGEQLRA